MKPGSEQVVLGQFFTEFFGNANRRLLETTKKEQALFCNALTFVMRMLSGFRLRRAGMSKLRASLE
jgi:hypothetical protein